MEYTQLDKTTQRNAILNRIRDLEQQHLTLTLRVNAPDLNSPPSEMDTANVERLESGISRLRNMLEELASETPPSQ